MKAWPAWTLAGIFLAMLVGTVHVLAEYVLDLRQVSTLYPRDQP